MKRTTSNSNGFKKSNSAPMKTLLDNSWLWKDYCWVHGKILLELVMKNSA